MVEPVRVAIIGMGGFAQSHHHAVAQLEKEGLCQLVAACDPKAEAFSLVAEELEFPSCDVRVFDDYRQMLDTEGGDLEVVTIPTPVPLHAGMHAASVARGLAVYLEKPPTLDYRELDQMIELDARGRRRTNVGFNYTIEGPRQELKRRLVSGEFGRVQQVDFLGLWPRPTSYYARASWAGRLTLGNQLVLDSCMGNAQAHFVHNALHWAGLDAVASWGQVKAVRAELYRAHAIESFDTIFAKAVTEDGVRLRLAESHACDGEQLSLERVICAQARIEYRVGGGWRIEHHDGRVEEGKPGVGQLLGANLAAYFAYAWGAGDRPVTSLVDSRPFVHLCDLALIAGGSIHQVAETDVRRSRSEGNSFVAIQGLEEAASRFLGEDLTPWEQGLSWGMAAGGATKDDLPQLTEVVAAMKSTQQGTGPRHCGE